MGPGRRRIERELQATRAAEQAKRAAAQQTASEHAKRIVAIWNARIAGGRELWFYPTIGAAVAAERPWLQFYCPACQQSRSADVARTHDVTTASDPSSRAG